MRICLVGVALALQLGSATATELRSTLPAIDTGASSGWAGGYVGASVGYGWIEDDDTRFAPLVPVLHSEGEDYTYGGHIGFLLQHDRLVGGFEYEYLQSSMEFIGEGPFPPFDGPLDVRLRRTNTFKLRAGYDLGWFLPYALGGFSHALVSTPTGDLKDWAYVVGAGVDFKLTDKLTLGVEYKHTWFDDFDDLPIEGTLDTVNVRLGYRF